MIKNKIIASFILGACGDSLGAPIEGIRNLDKIITTYGENGLSELIAYESIFEKGEKFTAGNITDDTTMAMTTALALLMTLKDSQSTNFISTLNKYTWQGYLNWAEKQIGMPDISDKIDNSIKWPTIAKDFWFACGAGRGTLASLSQNSIGSLEKPLTYDCEIKGKKVKSPGLGCGGMMRVVPIAFTPNLSDKKIFELGCRNAAITHGGQAAYVATGIIALYIKYATQDLSPTEIINNTKKILSLYEKDPIYKDGIKEALQAINYTNKQPEFNLQEIDKLPKNLGYKNPFLAIPVLAQVTHTLLYATSLEKVKKAIILSANHSGDSDSVAAIVGNILGARYGIDSIPNNWKNTLISKQSIEKIGVDLATQIQQYNKN